VDASSGRRPAARGPAAGARAVVAVLEAAMRAPFTRQAGAEVLYCAVAVLVGIGGPVAVLAFAVLAGRLAPGPGKPDNASIGGLAAAVLVLLGLAPLLGRAGGAVHRRLAARLLGEPVAPPAPVRPGRGLPGRLAARLGDRAGWRAAGYLLVKLPVGWLAGYAVSFWVTGLVDASVPLWWGLFRNHPAGVQLSPVPVLTPFGRVFATRTYPGTFASAGVGAALLLAAVWATRAVTAADRSLIRALLGPGRLAQRVHELERSRAAAVDDSAALLRRLERDLHDGAQIRLAALALNLGLAREKLAGGAAGDSAELDLAAVRELVDTAHRGAKDALRELRDLARGIHPPVLDNGLADALATLAAGSPVQVELSTDITTRPTPAIETIAYFCAAELLANATKHSYANTVEIRAADRDGVLWLAVTDDGIGGADPVHGSGLAGLRQRVSTVDGRLHITSPPGGPTRITAELPLGAGGSA
jgi:signal transduction histidine kinase